MIFLFVLAIIFLLQLTRKYIEQAVGWLLAQFTSIPVAFTKEVVPNLLRVVVLNWYTFLIIGFLWLLLFATSVGKDIINAYLSNLDELNRFTRFGSLLSLIACLLLMSLSIWSIPFFIYSANTRRSIKRNARRFYISTKLLAFVAMLPFLVVTNAFLAYYDPFHGGGIWDTLIINFISFFLFLLLVYSFGKTKPLRLPGITSSLSVRVKRYFKNPYLFILVKVIGWIALLTAVFVQFHFSRHVQALAVSVLFFVSSVILFRLLFYSPGQPVVDPQAVVANMLSPVNSQHSKRLYLTVLFFLIAATLYYYFAPSLEPISPLYILLIVLSLFIIYLDFWRNIFRNRKGILKITAVMANLLFLSIGFISRKDQFIVPLLSNTQLPQASPSLEEALQQRLARINATDSTGPVYIICAMGGGSRAGYISAAVLRTLDKMDSSLWGQTLCYSSISGGSVGIYNYMKGMETGQINDDHYLPYIYQKNYNSSGVFGLLVGDALETFFGSLLTKPKEWLNHTKPSAGYFDRNYRLRREYDYVLDQAMRNDTQPGYFKKIFYPLTTALPVPDHFKEYYAAHKDSIPIQLINSFEINAGQRSVLSPFAARDPHFFINAILPLQDTLYDANPADKDIQYREAVNLSELFPIVSAASHIGKKSKAQFVDGGYYENYGLATALDVYFFLKSLPMNIARVKIILIKNSVQEPSVPGENLQLLAPLVGALHSPFTGHANHILEETKRVMDSSHLFVITFNADSMKVPLTRSFTRSHIDSMNVFIKTLPQNQNLQRFLEQVKIQK